jgi:hypothetical protein
METHVTLIVVAISILIGWYGFTTTKATTTYITDLANEQDYNLKQALREQQYNIKKIIYETKPILTPNYKRTTKPSAHQDARYIRRPRQS